MKKLSRITEAEVIAEFLKAEYYRSEFARDRHKFEPLVYCPNLADRTENAIRRALLFRRRASMWRELPENTQWWEIELDPQDLARVNVFPRGPWLILSRGDYSALHVAERIGQQLNEGKVNDFLEKIQVLRTRLRYEGPKSVAILIGVNEDNLLTLLEGNHRFVSSLLLPPDVMLRRLRLVCGLSPDMEKCCWYKTTLPNLSRYLKNRIKHIRDREADVTRVSLPENEVRAGAANVSSIKTTGS